MKRGHRNKQGFTVVEVLTVVGVVAILAGLGISVYAGNREAAREAKLESDVVRVNTAVGVYEAMGGSLEGVTTPEGVVARLRTVADAVTAEQTPGITGSMVDMQLGVQMQSEAEASGSEARAIWDIDAKRFRVARTGEGGVAAFTRDAGNAAVLSGEEARNLNLKYAATDKWIWDFADVTAVANPAPTEVPFGDVPTGPTGPPSGGPGPNPGPGPGPGPTALDPPQFSVPSGSFPISDFELTVSLSNPNPAASSSIIYSLDGSNWYTYGGPLSVRPGVEVKAFAHSLVPEFTDSAHASEHYSATPITLEKPLIAASAGAFDYEDNRIVSVSMSDPNPAEASLIQYRVNSGIWKFYREAFDLEAEQYGSGAAIEARAFPLSEYYLMSDVATANIDAAAPADLLAPNIYTSALKFDYDVHRVVSVTIVNPNSTEHAQLEYRVDGGAWAPYGGAFDLNIAQYQVSPATIEARVVSTVPHYLDSPVAVAVVAEPDPLFEISGETSGRFENTQGGRRMVYDIVTDEAANTTFFTWGDSANSNPASSLLFAGQTFLDVSPGEQFLIGTLDYYNGTIWSRTGANAVELMMDLTFYDATADTTFDFAIDLLNTVNTDDPWASADYVQLQDVASELTQTINGREYFLKLEFGETSSNGFSTIDEFHVLENASATGSLYGTLWLADLEG
ncbi:MAG: choice-of-anchor K domain-containing protein [Verrucomicrobiota bacterium]